MRIFFRADASVSIGTGHVMRCMTLAQVLNEQGADISFICRTLPGDCSALIENKGYNLFRLNETSAFSAKSDAEQTAHILQNVSKPDWLVIDHYEIAVAWERRVRPYCGRVLVIDDLADRHHDCEVLLDQNLYDDMRKRYHHLVPSICKLLIGPDYALLRNEFKELRLKKRKRDGVVRRILVFFGGSDPTNETEKALMAIQMLECTDIAVDVVVGAANPNSMKIRTICSGRANVVFHHQVDNMAELMAKADLSIGAGGSATWERCAVGLPAIIVSVADNQTAIAESAHKAGAVTFLGCSADVDVSMIACAIRLACSSKEQLIDMSEKALSLVDGDGTIKVADIMVGT